MSSAERWAKYAETVLYLAASEATVRVGWAPLGNRADSSLGPRGQALYIVTAYNPDGVDRDPRENANAHADLENELRWAGLEFWPAATGDLAWSHVELSLAIVGIGQAAALTLGNRCGREAIFELTPRFRTVLSCRDGRKLVTGAQIDQLRSENPEAVRAHAGLQVAFGAYASSSAGRDGMPGRIDIGAICARCDRQYHPDLADANTWNMVLREGCVVALVCPECQFPEEDLEAQVNQANLLYQADDQGRIWNALKATGYQATS